MAKMVIEECYQDKQNIHLTINPEWKGSWKCWVFTTLKLVSLKTASTATIFLSRIFIFRIPRAPRRSTDPIQLKSSMTFIRDQSSQREWAFERNMAASLVPGRLNKCTLALNIMGRFLGITVKRLAPCRCLDGHIKEPYRNSMALGARP